MSFKRNGLGALPVALAAIASFGAAAGTNTARAWSEVGDNYVGLGFSVSSGDFNNDGYSDLIVGSPYYSSPTHSYEGAAYVYFGSPHHLPVTVRKVTINQTNALFGAAVAGIGDVNGDGYEDFAVGSVFYSNGQSNEGGIFIYYGNNTYTLSVGTVLEINQADANMFRVARAGDLNKDGYDDLIVGAPGHNGDGAAFVYLGGASGVATTPAQTLTGGTNSAFGLWVSGGGDVNGDGYADVVVGAPGYSNGHSGEGGMFVYHGNNSGSGVSATPSAVVEGNATDATVGLSVAMVGDVNGDGYADVATNLFPSSVNEQVRIYPGGSGGINPSGSYITLKASTSPTNFGVSIAAVGDLNGDGENDVLVGAPDDSSMTPVGGVYAFFGPFTAGTTYTRAPLLANTQGASLYGYAIGSAGDYNGDGIADLAVGSPQWDDGTSTDNGKVWLHTGIDDGLTYDTYVVDSVSISGSAPSGGYTFHVSSPTAGVVTLKHNGVSVATLSYVWTTTVSASNPAQFYTFSFPGYLDITVRKAGSGTQNLYGMDQSIFNGAEILWVP